MNKYLRYQNVVFLRIIILYRLGILPMVYRRVVSDLSWPVFYRWVMGQNPDGSHDSGSNYIDPLSALQGNGKRAKEHLHPSTMSWGNSKETRVIMFV